MEKPPEPNLTQGTDKPSNPEQEKIRIVPVEELIPGMKPGPKENIREIHSGNHFDNAFMPELLKKFTDLTSHEEALKILRERFKDQVLVDLGTADSSGGYLLAVVLGCKGYVGVEKFWHRQFKEGLEGWNMEAVEKYAKLFDFFEAFEGNIKPEMHLVPASAVNEDMLSFLQKLPANSVSVITSGIDSFVIPQDNYRREVAKELERVLSTKGMYITCASDIFANNLVPFHETLKTCENSASYDTAQSRFKSFNSSRSGLYVKKEN